MKLHLITLRFVALTSLGCAPLSATAALYTGIYAFGDSLTDAGNTSLASGGASPGAAYYNGRYSNGPVWVEDLAKHLGLPAMIPSLLGGSDYAFGGAYTQTGGSVPTISQQAGMFMAGGGTVHSTDLFVVWGGANDFLLGGQNDPTIPAGNIGAVITQLAGAGARTFIIPNMPDLGDTPALTSTGFPAAIIGASNWSVGYNLTLAAEIPTLEATLGIDIRLLDVFSIAKELKNNAAAFGFTDTTDSALLTGNAANADHYLYWDSVHPTSVVHDIFAERACQLLDSACPEPGVTISLMMSLIGLVVRRRRPEM